MLEDMRVKVTHCFAAPPGEVWALLSDVERMAGLGPEHAAATWLDRPGAGARFTGTNARGDRTWTVPCQVVVYDEPREFSWQVGDPDLPTATWSYQLAPDADGTLVTQVFRHGPGRSFLRQATERHPERADELVAGRAAELAANMTAVLQAAQDLLAQ